MYAPSSPSYALLWLAGTFMYVFLGYQLRSLMELLDNPSSLGVEYQLLFVLGVSLTAVTTLYLANEARVVGINAELHDWSKEAKRHDDLHHSDPNESHVEVSLVETAPGVHRETKGGGGGRVNEI